MVLFRKKQFHLQAVSSSYSLKYQQDAAARSFRQLPHCGSFGVLQFLEDSNRSDNMLIVITSDHGEMLSDRYDKGEMQDVAGNPEHATDLAARVGRCCGTGCATWITPCLWQGRRSAFDTGKVLYRCNCRFEGNHRSGACLVRHPSKQSA